MAKEVLSLNNSDFNKQLVYEVYYNLYDSSTRIKRDDDETRTYFLKYLINLNEKIQVQLPVLTVKELTIGKCTYDCCLLIPYYPKVHEFPNEDEMLKRMGYFFKKGVYQSFD
jgi:hypothetical protein